MRASAAPLGVMPSARGKAVRPRRYGRALQNLHGANPGCARSFGLLLQIRHHEDLNRMESIMPMGQALAASVSLSLASIGTKLTSGGERLKVHAAKYGSIVPAAAAAGVLLSIQPAMAQGTTGGSGSLDSFLLNVVNMITGPTGQAIAIIAVAVCGLGAMFGALSARAFGGVVLGCAIVFSAAWIVGKITGNGAA